MRDGPSLSTSGRPPGGEGLPLLSLLSTSRCRPLPVRLQPLLERHARLPAYVAANPARVGACAVLVAWGGGMLAYIELLAREALHDGDYISH